MNAYREKLSYEAALSKLKPTDFMGQRTYRIFAKKAVMTTLLL